MSKTKLLVQGAPLHLPRCGPLRSPRFLRAGPHEIPSEEWTSVQNHAAVRAWIKQGRLIENPKPADVVASDPPDRLGGLREMTIGKAIPHIESSADRDQLERWRNADSRKGIRDAVDDRIAELDLDDDVALDNDED